MTISELQAWIVSSKGMANELRSLTRFAAARSFGSALQVSLAIDDYRPEWGRLLLASSILSVSQSAKANEIALVVAQAGMLYSENRQVSEASATVLVQLSNRRAVQLATERDHLAHDFDERLGIYEQLLMTRRYFEQSVWPITGDAIQASRFQSKLWLELGRSGWVSASAPTASGKTYLVLRWLIDEFTSNRARLAVFLAPTRALVGEVERELLELARVNGVKGLRVTSLPSAALGDQSLGTILVLTQERLHVFMNALNAADEMPSIDLAVIDEAHKIGDGLRGVLLQDAVERLVRSSPEVRLVFLSPLTQNPETLLADAPVKTVTAVVPDEAPTVVQNLVIAEQVSGYSDRWQLSLRNAGNDDVIGEVTLHARPDTQVKRLSYVALAVGRHQSGTLVYANGAAEAEKIAWQIFEGLGEELSEGDEELKSLSDFARETIHPKFQLVELVRRGVAFHYGNMPTLLRAEIERLFRIGKIRFLVCTSTLVEGVNISCRTIVARGPRKGRRQFMNTHDFWNLAGRAGRWGQDFSGNIVCVDESRVDLWPHGVPGKSRYPIDRETDSVLRRRTSMLGYLENRKKIDPSAIDPSLEQVTAYMLAWRSREGTFVNCPSAVRISPEYARELDQKLGAILSDVDISPRVISRHPGVSAVGLQSLLGYFRKRRKPVEELLPAAPESSDAHGRLIAIFRRINSNVYPAFMPSTAVPVHALVTLEWMRGLPLSRIIRNRIRYLEERRREYRLANVIRDTMREVEEIARFRAPKYLAAYVDVLRFYLREIGQGELLAEDLKFDIYLEFGVSTETLLSLIGLGLSRTTAVAVNDFLGDDSMSEDSVYQWIQSRRWETLDIPTVVRRELHEVLALRSQP